MANNDDAAPPPARLSVHMRMFRRPLENNHGEEDVNAIVRKLVATNIEVINELLDLASKIEGYQGRFRIAKTTGTSVGAAGAISMLAGLCLAPVTAGASAALTVGGMVATATSGVSALGSEIFNKVQTKRFMSKINDLRDKQAMAAMELTEQLRMLDYVMEAMEQAGINEEIAVRTALQWLKDNVLGLFRMPSGEISVQNVTTLVSQVTRQVNDVKNLAISTAALIGPGIHVLGDAAKGTVAVFSDVATTVGEVTLAEIRNLRQFIRSAGQTVTGATGKSLAKGIGITAGVVFTVVDVALLVRDWNNPHPLLAVIQSTVERLIRDIALCEESMFLIQRLENYGRCELDCGI